uniref:Uncharacterized protein n=1 Tax=Cajanus cajan TaxID=3821 RepID=A0A151RUN9_CAJCA|nr:hypothetical protein KK1_032133 [Cajanus cajan]
MDFVVMDIEEDMKICLILGRPFMKIAKVIIDVEDKRLKVRVQDKEVNFNVFKAMQHPSDKNDCIKMDVFDDVILLENRCTLLALWRKHSLRHLSF